jgi:hypothetical protein
MCPQVKECFGGTRIQLHQDHPGCLMHLPPQLRSRIDCGRNIILVRGSPCPSRGRPRNTAGKRDRGRQGAGSQLAGGLAVEIHYPDRDGPHRQRESEQGPRPGFQHRSTKDRPLRPLVAPDIRNQNGLSGMEGTPMGSFSQRELQFLQAPGHIIAGTNRRLMPGRIEYRDRRTRYRKEFHERGTQPRPAPTDNPARRSPQPETRTLTH